VGLRQRSPANIEARARSGYFRAGQGFETLGEAIARYRADHGSQLPLRLGALTTPVAYLTSIPTDPFANTGGLPPGYLLSGDSYLLRSFGPDADEATGGDLPWSDAEAMNALLADQPRLLPYTYDPSNGTFSEGDLWRVGGNAIQDASPP